MYQEILCFTHQLWQNLVLYDSLGKVIAVICQATERYCRGLLDTATTMLKGLDVTWMHDLAS